MVVEQRRVVEQLMEVDLETSDSKTIGDFGEKKEA